MEIIIKTKIIYRGMIIKMKKSVILIAMVVFIVFSYFFYVNFVDNSVEALSKYGSSGNEVKQIQQKLKDWGYYKGNVDRCLWK